MFEQVLAVLQRDLESCRVTADPAALKRAQRDIPRRIPSSGLGEEASARLLFDTIAPALAAGQAGPHYYGFVTGGRTPVSLAADCLVSSYDANVQVHLPEVTIATEIEQVAADLVLDLLGISPSHFPGRSITTGATASNILGLALGRQFAISRVLGEKYDVAEDGFGGVDIDIFAAGAHASIRKAAALVGIGRSRVIDLTDAQATDEPVAFDLAALEARMKEARTSGRGVIVCPSYGEVNTGAFTPDMQRIRELCDTYGAWMHLDAAFGAFAVLHPDFETEIRAGLQLADSLTVDAHKWLNVPYDCALFYTRSSAIHAAVMGPGGEVPAYLSTSGASIPSPLNTRIENSSRFRALPLYASLVCYGRSGYQDIVRRNIAFAREIEAWLIASPHYDVLTPSSTSSSQGGQFRLLNIVLFAPARTCGVKRFEDAETGGQEMVKSINETGEIYVTGTKWKGRSGARLAVSNHLTGQSDGGAHFKAVVRRLDAIMM